MTANPRLAELARELVALRAKTAAGGRKPEPWSLERFVGAHGPALAYARDRAQWQHVMCARQAGKSFTSDGLLLDNARRRPRSNNVLLGLNGKAVRRNNWVPIWRQTISARYSIPRSCNNDTNMVCTLPNGSRVMFAGTDDYQHILTYLGNRLDGGVFIIDEAQDAKASVLEPLVYKILPPMLTPTSRVILSGTIPDVPAGFFWRERQKARWSKHNWGRFANVHTPEARDQLAAYLRDTGISEDDPAIQRDWYGRAVFDEAARAFRYVEEKNGYRGATPADLRWYAVGIDPGAFDRTAIVVVGWGEGTGLWVVEEWVTATSSGTAWSDIGAQLSRIQKTYRPGWYYADFGGAKMSMDVLGRDYGVPLLMAAKKGDRRGQVDRLNAAFVAGQAHVPIGSALENDLIRTQWDKDARERGDWEWSNHNHPDVADAFRYAAHAYFEAATKEHVVEDKTPSIARRLKLLKNTEQEGYFERRERELG